MPQSDPHWPVDGHVHFHSRSRVAPTLDAAVEHFRSRTGRSAGLLGALLLTQTSGESVYEWLRDQSSVGAWLLTAVPEEPESLVACRDRVAVAIVCGRQVRADDGIEVLGLGTCEKFADGLPLADAVNLVQRSGAVTVLPWGFGKWFGDRGRRVARLLETLGPGDVFVGDNGNRLAALGPPSLIRMAQRKGFRVLPGTDPFPLSGAHRRVGGFGFWVPIEPPATAPWRTLRNWLMSQKRSPPAFGRAVGPLRFVRDQVGLRLHKSSR